MPSPQSCPARQKPESIRKDRIPAVVLAGGINRIELRPGYRPALKALIPFAGRPAAAFVLEALSAAPGVGPICLIGPQRELRQALKDRPGHDILSPAKSLAGNIALGLEHFRRARSVLFVTADLPLLTSAAIEAFLAGCQAAETGYRENLFWSAVPEDSFRGPYRQIGKGFNRFRDVAVCHGNLMLATPGLLDLPRALDAVDAIYRARKSSPRAALAIGWRPGLFYLLGVQLMRILTLERMCRIVSGHFQAGLVPVLVRHPEVAVDVDEPPDYDFVKRRIEGEEPVESCSP